MLYQTLFIYIILLLLFEISFFMENKYYFKENVFYYEIENWKFKKFIFRQFRLKVKLFA